MAPYDPDDRHARLTHRGARPERRPLPDHLISLGRTIGLRANGAVSNLAITPFAVSVLGRELRHGGYDVIHVHEPNAPMVSWFATVAGAPPAEVEPYLPDDGGIEIAGRVSEDEKWRLLHEADLLCAPSLGGESFGMVLTEAFAAGTPVVASDIAGYRDVVRGGTDGLLVPAGEPVALGEGLLELALAGGRPREMEIAARQPAEPVAWPPLARAGGAAYEEADE